MGSDSGEDGDTKCDATRSGCRCGNLAGRRRLANSSDFRERRKSTDKCRRDRHRKLIRFSAHAPRAANSYVISESRPARRPIRKASSEPGVNRTFFCGSSSATRATEVERARSLGRVRSRSNETFVNDNPRRSCDPGGELTNWSIARFTRQPSRPASQCSAPAPRS
jgi:hypothetical protein